MAKLVAAWNVEPGMFLQHRFDTHFGSHVIKGRVQEVSLERTVTGREYMRLVWTEAVCSDVLGESGRLYGVEGLRMSNYASPHPPSQVLELLEDDGILEQP